MTSPQGQDQVSASLLPCPWCGGPGSPTEYLKEGSASRWHRITCEACEIVGPEVEGHSLSFHGATGRYETEAIAAWNRRTPPPAVSEVRDAVALEPGDLDYLRGLLKEQIEGGHCGEGNVETRARYRHNDRIERLILALPLPRMGAEASTPKEQPK